MPWRLVPGALYFQRGGRQSFLLGRNPTGWQVAQFEPLLRWARESGESLVRIHVQSGMAPRAAPGEIDEAWAQRWERVFDRAAHYGLHVLPVMDAWAQWNDGSGGHSWRRWEKNAYNAANGGPAKSPVELFRDTECRRLWLGWLAKVVRRWQARPTIIGWEVFSELDLVTGATEPAGVAFMELAAAVVRRHDLRGRPVTASLSGIRQWPTLFAGDAVDIVQVHPYANLPRFKGNLDELILHSVRQRLKRYGKPAMIGESGLDARDPRGTVVTSPRAEIGVRHAIWAAAVSGAMNGRMLWWEDGYDQYLKMDLRTRHRHAAAPVARFVRDVNFAGLRPLAIEASKELIGAALGSERVVLVWLRDKACAAPDWPLRRVVGGTVTVPGKAALWRVGIHDTGRGDAVQTRQVHCDGSVIRVPLPPFEGSIALKMVATAPVAR